MSRHEVTIQKDASIQVDGWKHGSYWTSGIFAVDASNKLVLFAGTVSHPALIGATMWVTVCACAADFVASIGTIGNVLTTLAFVIFALLPEIIAYKAVVKCLKLWRYAFTKHETNEAGKQYALDRATRITRFAWAGLYSLPTLVFVSMTLLTLLPFTLSHGQVSAIAGNTLGIRAVSGWFYVFLGLIEKEMRTMNDVGEMWYTSVAPLAVQPKYTTSHQIKAQSLVLPSHIPTGTQASQSATKHSETLVNTLETEHDVIVDTVASTSHVESQDDVQIKTTMKSETSDVKKVAVNKSNWIRSMYVAHPDASISDIQSFAIAGGFTVSRGLVSSLRA